MPTLNWLNKEKSLKITDKIPFKLLEEQDKYSYGDENTENMLIQGDNLDALKALLPFYSGQVKCIYIDPPYNTGGAFEHYDDNLEHSLWLDLIYPRLELLHKLLNENGSIWISIDDDECHYLKVICDEIFGRKNFVANVIWEKKFSPQNDAKWLSDSHDHILAYAKNKDTWKPQPLPRTETMDARYKNPDNDPRGVWTSSDLTAQDPFEYGLYEIVGPTGKRFSSGNNRHWIYAKEKTEELVKDNRIWFGEKGNNKPRLKKFLNEVKEGSVSKTIWYRTEVGDNQEAKREIKIFNNDDVFATPKPERLVQRILNLASQEGDWILDSFVGSGTAASVAHKMNRKWIGIEMGEHAVTHCYPRLKKVVDGEQGGISESLKWKGGGGFRFYKLGASIFLPDGTINPEVRFKTLASHIWFSETKTSLKKIQKSPFLGNHQGTGYYLLFNGILGDKRPNGGNVLTNSVLKELPKHKGPKVIYGEMTTIGKTQLKQKNIIFKQIPYDVRAC